MVRSLVVALALASSPAFASSDYHAVPSAAPAKPTVVTRDSVWTCGGGACVARRGNSRAEVACGALVREVGALSSFAANGTAFDEQQLARCNARAR